MAKSLNEGWRPDWNNVMENKWVIKMISDNISPDYYVGCNGSIVYFRTKELAQQAIQILGEETIKLALSTDY